MLGQHVYIEPEQSDDSTGGGFWLDASYVVENEDGTCYVWAASSRDKLEKRSITVSEKDEMFYRYLVTGGLTLDDRIAIPDDTLTEGLPVTDEMPEPSEDDNVDNGGTDDGGFDNGGVVDGGMDGGISGNYADGGIDSGLIEGGIENDGIDEVGVIDSIPEENTEGAQTQPVEGEG